MTTYTAVLGTPDSTPALALSLLRGRVQAIEQRGKDAVRQVGIASAFRLENVKDKLALVCRVELHDEKQECKDLHVGIHPLLTVKKDEPAPVAPKVEAAKVEATPSPAVLAPPTPAPVKDK